MRRLLAIDLSFQSYRASAANPNLTSDGVFTGGVYGFFQTLGKLVRESNATELVVCRDMKPYRRSAEFPEYKAFRKSTADPELKERHLTTMGILEDVLDQLGVPVWGIPGFESDDLIGHVVHKYRHRYDHIIAGSNDSDLFQLMFTDKFSLVGTDWVSRWDQDRLTQELGVTPEEYMLATALMGTHNDLPGIPKVGKVTAFKAIKEPGKLRKLMEAHNDIVQRNLKLIKLPHADFPWGACIPKPTRDFSARAMYRSLGRYDIDVTMSMSNALERTLT